MDRLDPQSWSILNADLPRLTEAGFRLLALAMKSYKRFGRAHHGACDLDGDPVSKVVIAKIEEAGYLVSQPVGPDWEYLAPSDQARKLKCPACNGQGIVAADDDHAKNCPRCEGVGAIPPGKAVVEPFKAKPKKERKTNLVHGRMAAVIEPAVERVTHRIESSGGLDRQIVRVVDGVELPVVTLHVMPGDDQPSIERRAAALLKALDTHAFWYEA